MRFGAFPISIDAKGLAEIARRDDVRKRSAQIREAMGEPGLVLLGVDRLDYTKGIRHRLQAYGELVAAGARLGAAVNIADGFARMTNGERFVPCVTQYGPGAEAAFGAPYYHFHRADLLAGAAVFVARRRIFGSR